MSLLFESLRQANFHRDIEWDPEDKCDLAFRAVELSGEVGEAMNMIKKLLREQKGIRGTRITLAEVADELADVVVCLDLLAMELEIDLGAAVKQKFNKTSEKYSLSVRLL